MTGHPNLRRKAARRSIVFGLGAVGLAFGLAVGLGLYLGSGSPEHGGSVAARALLAATYEEEPNPVRPTEPPQPGRDVPVPPPEPKPPPDIKQLRVEAYEEAQARGDPRPAETAFRKAVDAFVEHNRQFADAQAQAEGLTVGEVKELTYFGFLAQQTQRWPEVEDILGNPLDEATRAAGEQLLHELNAEFKAAMRALVKSGGTEDERWALIRDVQDRYLEGYLATTGMTPEGLQDLLAGDLRRKYPLSETPGPEVLAEQAEPPKPPPPRPEEPPSGHPTPAGPRGN